MKNGKKFSFSTFSFVVCDTKLNILGFWFVGRKDLKMSALETFDVRFFYIL